MLCVFRLSVPPQKFPAKEIESSLVSLHTKLVSVLIRSDHFVFFGSFFFFFVTCRSSGSSCVFSLG